MDYSLKTRNELIKICKEKNIKRDYILFDINPEAKVIFDNKDE